MKTKFANRFSYATLRSEALDKVNLMQRDADAFAQVGVTADAVEQLRTRADMLVDQPADKLSLYTGKTATAEKNRLSVLLRERAVELQLKAKVAFGSDSMEYANYVLPQKLKNEELTTSLRTILTFAQLQKVELADCMLTEEWLLSTQNLLDSYEAALLKQRTAIQQRDMATQERHRIANELFADLRRYAEIGRDLWRHTDTAKANDYRLPVRKASPTSIPEMTEAA